MTDPTAQPARSMPEDLPPGPISRAARYLGLTDDSAPLVRGTRPWWIRTGVLTAGLLVMMALVALGG